MNVFILFFILNSKKEVTDPRGLRHLCHVNSPSRNITDLETILMINVYCTDIKENIYGAVKSVQGTSVPAT